MTPMFLEVTERLAVQSSPVPMQDRVHHQNQLTVIVQEKVLRHPSGIRTKLPSRRRRALYF